MDSVVNKLDQACRICSENQEKTTAIFSDEGKELYLQAKIRRYLYITISIEDKFPKIICDDCCTKLEEIHKFATMAVKSQDKFVKLFSNSKSTTTDNTEKPSNGENRGLLHSYLTKGTIQKSVNSTPQKDQNYKSDIIDRSIKLANIDIEDKDEKDNSDKNNDTEISIRIEKIDSNDKSDTSDKSDRSDKSDNEVTEMEVRIDPMLILQCNEEMEMSNISTPEDDDNDTDHSSSKSDNSTDEYIKRRKPYNCSVCPRRFTCQFALQNHMWSHLNYGRKALSNSDNNSIKSQSEQEACDASENTESSNENANNCRFNCPVCGKKISTKGNLKVHLETHRPKGKYGCDICGRIFKTQSNLYRHKEYHGGVQYPCTVCGRVYPTNSTLRAHSITHSDLRPHKCPLCDKTFKRNQDLKFHINQHTGARPYQCPYCPKAFASSGNCFSHRKRMHPQEVERDREKAAEIMR